MYVRPYITCIIPCLFTSHVFVCTYIRRMPIENRNSYNNMGVFEGRISVDRIVYLSLTVSLILKPASRPERETSSDGVAIPSEGVHSHAY